MLSEAKHLDERSLYHREMLHFVQHDMAFIDVFIESA